MSESELSFKNLIIWLMFYEFTNLYAIGEEVNLIALKYSWIRGLWVSIRDDTGLSFIRNLSKETSNIGIYLYKVIGRSLILFNIIPFYVLNGLRKYIIYSLI